MAECWAILDEVGDEILKQDLQWGAFQDHPNGSGAFDYQLRADGAKAANDTAVQRDTVTWAGILNEEFYEALAEKDPVRLREELLQVAAVSCQWISAIDRRV